MQSLNSEVPGLPVLPVPSVRSQVGDEGSGPAHTCSWQSRTHAVGPAHADFSCCSQSDQLKNELGVRNLPTHLLQSAFFLTQALQSEAEPVPTQAVANAWMTSSAQVVSPVTT